MNIKKSNWDYIIFTIFLCLLVFLSVILANYKVDIREVGINACDEISEEKDEAYWECLEQNDLTQWNMENPKISLTIQWWGILFLL